MKKVPITDVINSWLNADARLEEKCKEEICEYDSISAYKGYMLGFEDGVQSQVNEDASKCVITKRDIVSGFKELNAGSCAGLLSGTQRCFRKRADHLTVPEHSILGRGSD